MPIVGDVLAERYRVDAPLGVGGMASVYRAHDLRLDRDVAVKVLLPNLAADPAVAKRFDREARSLAATAHPSVVSVFDVEPGDPATGREPFYVMELCDGGSLADRIARQGRLDPATLAAVIAAVAEGLADLHRRGVVHRDVKPHNILFSGGRPKLADFGLATSGRGAESALTAAGTTVGTLAYLAPELIAGAPASQASDVYALGVVAFHALTGRLPRPGATLTQVVESRTSPAPKPSSVTPRLGPAFDRPIAAALAIDPASRPTPTGFADALREAATTHMDEQADTMTAIPIVARPVPGRASRGSARGRPALAALALFALIVATLVALSSLLGGRNVPAGGPSGSPLALATASPSPSPSPSPTPSPTPTPVATPTPDPAAAALRAVDDVVAAIESAKQAGLKGKDVNDLLKRATAVRDALRRHDYQAARRAADDLAKQIDGVDRIGDAARRRLRDSVAALIEAIPASSGQD